MKRVFNPATLAVAFVCTVYALSYALVFGLGLAIGRWF